MRERPLLFRSGTSRSILAVVLALSIPILSIAGCRETRDRSGLLANVPTEQLRLVGTRTGIGELTITVPKPFVLDDDGGSDLRDNFFVTDLADTGAVQKGMIYLSVGLTPLPFIPDSIEIVKTGGTIAGEDVEWRESIGKTETGEKLYRREVIARDLFELVPSPGTSGTYLLQAFVVGTDPALVERLMASVETITPAAKGNL